LTDEIVVEGLGELLAALKTTDAALAHELREGLREGGQKVQGRATARFLRYSQRTARGFRTIVRKRGVSVEQSLRKTTGLRPDWGGVQMVDGLIPAAEEELPEVERIVERKVVGLLHRNGLL
jgi:hypothetical protein